MEVLTRVISKETNSHPSTRRNSNGVPFGGVDKIELCRVIFRVKVSETLANNKDIVAMEMERVALSTKYASVLHHHFHTCVERQHHNSRPVAHIRVVRRCPGVIERDQRSAGKISGVNPIGLVIEVGLEKRCGGE